MSTRAVLAAVDAVAPAALAACRFVHAHPELAHEEVECSSFLAGLLAGAGLEVERGVAGMPTAFVARLVGARPGRSVGLVALYDAVAAVRPDGSIEPVHSCGHGPIAGGAAGAALALARLREELPGEVLVVGCPADEIHAPGTRRRGGGKALTAAAGVWDGLDAALYAHPEFVDTVSTSSRWMRRDRALVSGIRTLRRPWEPPIEAAHTLLQALRDLPADVMLERLEVDGDVEEGTGLVLRADVLLFADDEAGIDALAVAVREALPDATWERGDVVRGVKPDAGVGEAVAASFGAFGRSFVADPPPLPFATDFGNVSHRVPAALIGVGREGGWRFHTDEGAEQFASPAGDEATLAIARVLALAARRLVEPCG